MKCPYCNEEMSKGILQSGRNIIWSTAKHKTTFNANHTKDELTIAKENLIGAYIDCYYCKFCDKIIINV